MNADKDYQLLIKYLSKETNEAENEQFLEWLNEGSKNQKLFNQCKDIYLSVGVQNATSRFDKYKKWKQIESRINKVYKKERSIIPINFMKVAATVVIAFVLGFFINYITSEQKQSPPWYEVQASLGSTSKVQLADGSTVWLNAGSKLKLAPDFNQKSRDVYLEGEAFFEVKQKQKQYFKVHTSDIFIKVLGTQFNVESYPEESTIETTLEEGSIQIYSINNSKQQLLTLKPNQKATFIKEKGQLLTSNIKNEVDDILNKEEKIEYRKANIIVASEVSTAQYTSWKEGQLIFKNETLGEIIKILERRYNVVITSHDTELNKKRITANFKNESVEQVMYALQLTSSLKYKIDKDSIVIYN